MEIITSTQYIELRFQNQTRIAIDRSALMFTLNDDGVSIKSTQFEYVANYDNCMINGIEPENNLDLFNKLKELIN